MADLSPYELRALKQVQEHREHQLAHSPRRLIPEKARTEVSRRAATVTGRVRKSAVGGRAADVATSSYKRVMDGVGKATSRLANTTLSEKRVMKALSRHGHTVTTLSDIRTLDLEVIDNLRPRRLDFLYAATAAAEGALAGGVISGGEALALFGSVESAGAAAAPGFGAVAAAVGGDALFVLAAGSRAVAHTSMYYGYDPNDPAEKLYIMAVLNLGTAATGSAKYLAYRELSQLAQQLARNATWAALRQHGLTRVAETFAAQMSVRLTQKKLGQLVPVVGIVTGGALNYGLLDSICDAAHWAYRERFLTDKQGGGSAFTLPEPPPEPGPDDQNEPAVSVLEILDQDEHGDDRPT